MDSRKRNIYIGFGVIGFVVTYYTYSLIRKSMIMANLDKLIGGMSATGGGSTGLHASANKAYDITFYKKAPAGSVLLSQSDAKKIAKDLNAGITCYSPNKEVVMAALSKIKTKAQASQVSEQFSKLQSTLVMNLGVPESAFTNALSDRVVCLQGRIFDNEDFQNTINEYFTSLKDF